MAGEAVLCKWDPTCSGGVAATRFMTPGRVLELDPITTRETSSLFPIGGGSGPQISYITLTLETCRPI